VGHFPFDTRKQETEEMGTQNQVSAFNKVSKNAYNQKDFNDVLHGNHST